MSEAKANKSAWHLLASLPLVLGVGFALRVLAAGAVQLYAQQKGTLCVFGDTNIYWRLAEALRTGASYEVSQWGIPHYSLRTPGYPAFLALCQMLFGTENTLAVRLVQAVIGASCAWLVYRLVCRILGAPAGRHRWAGWTVPMAAGLLVAIEPYTVGMSALILSEALFVPLMLLQLWGMAALWPRQGEAGPKRPILSALGTGLAAGLAILVRPSWALFVPVALVVWVLAARSKAALRGAALLALATAVVMTPWWVRNAQIHGRFVPTALWVGPSLYDGLSPHATGASDMEFLNDPEIRVLDEETQDTVLTRRALAFAQENPRRALELAAIKAARFWSPWPHAEAFDAPGVPWLSALATIPVFVLILVGLWDRRRDPRAWLLLAGPVLYFMLLHMVFVSSIRYRIPGEVPALGLAAIGLGRLLGRRLIRERSPARRAALWVVGLPLAVAGGGAWLAFSYVTDSATLTAVIEGQGSTFLPGSNLRVGKVRVRPMVGETTVEHVFVEQNLDGQGFSTLRIAWLRLQHDIWALLRGDFEPRRIIVAQPILRIGQRQDGTWNLEDLLADPWPGPPLVQLPLVLIRNGTIQLAQGDNIAAILRDVNFELQPAGDQVWRFEGTALGDGFERLTLAGTFNMDTGALTLHASELIRLEISETLSQRLPDDWRAGFEQLGLRSGQADILLSELTYDPKTDEFPKHEAILRLRTADWNCPDLPFPISGLSATGFVKDGLLTLERASGHNGRTTVFAGGQLDLNDPEAGPLDLTLDVLHLDLDNRLKAKTPPDLLPLWDEFRPKGTVDVHARIVRAEPGAEIDLGMIVDCQDVGMTFHECPYSVEHISGRLVWDQDRIVVERATTLIGNRPAACWGTIDNPGEDAHVQLHFELEALPIDETLFQAMPPEVLEVVTQFQPRGVVAVPEAFLERLPPTPEFPEGEVIINATLVADGRVQFTWEELPYPITDVSGRMRLAPDRWVFEDVRGWNGLAEIEGDGWVEAIGPDLFNADLHIRARNLPFNLQLKNALPPEWIASWNVLNPSGSTTLDARITVERNEQHHHMTIIPEADTSIRLAFIPTPLPGDPEPPRPLELPPMEHAQGMFVYDDGVVSMRDVSFQFRDSPVSFHEGTVRVEQTGQFDLAVSDLRVTNFRIDSGLRRLMPPIMAEFAQKLDEGTSIPLMRGNMRLGWSGLVGEPAWVAWDEGVFVFNGQTIQTGLPLRHIQGRIDQVEGQFDGQEFAVRGRIDLDSVNLEGQQITRLRSPIVVADGLARLDNIQGDLLGGALSGQIGVSLDTTPRYEAALAVENADLARFTMTLPGRQDFRGLFSGQLALNGMGSDMKTIKGQGNLRIDQGDLGELPAALRMFNYLKLSRPTKTAFDSASVDFLMQDGLAYLDPIRLTGDVISLLGAGTLDLQGDLNLRLRMLYGRDRFRIPLLTDAVREASGQIFDVRVTGPASFPRFQLEALPSATEAFRASARALFQPEESRRR